MDVLKRNFGWKIDAGTILSMVVCMMVLVADCSKKHDIEQPQEIILVRVGDKTISLNEFIRRAEYTVRPPYCRGNHNLDKKIVLNSLIAEKLFAIEAGDSNEFVMSPRVQAQLKGRLEQAMRQWLFEEEAQKKVVLDTFRLKKMLQVAGRKYKISYFNYPDSATIFRMKEDIKENGKAFEDVYFDVTKLDTLPKREVEWSMHEHDLILDSLFAGPLKKNQVVGPIRIEKNHYMLIKINGWIDRPAITQPMVQERWRNITDEYSRRAAVKLYDDFIRKVMKGKTIEFQPDAFFKITELLGPIYIQTDKEKQEMLKKSIWEQENDDLKKYQDLQTQIEMLYQEPLFKVDGIVWTVKDFMDELAVHPLVFRKKRMKKSEFGQQLQFAIMDMIRDKYLAQVAYKRGYDKINVIRRNVNMWKDNLSYQYFKAKYLQSVKPDSVEEMEYIPLIETYLNPLVDSLQQKYSDQIEVEVQAFNDLKLTRIDMSVIQENVPYAKVVPSFPLVTTDNRLDYGRRMKTDSTATTEN